MNNFKIKDLMISVYPQAYYMQCDSATSADCHAVSANPTCGGSTMGDCNKTSCEGATMGDCNKTSCEGATMGDCNKTSCDGATMGEAYFGANDHAMQREAVLAAGLLNLKQALAGMQNRGYA